MTTLTTALACAGGLVLAAVVAHGAWQARKAGPLRPAPPQPPAPPREPVLYDDPALPDAAPAELGPLDAASAVDGDEPVLVPPRRVVPAVRVDPLIDAIASLGLDAPVAGEGVLPHLPATRRAGSKPFLIEGLNAETAEWEPPQPGRRYRDFQAGLQLANRTGALNEIEYSEFVQKVQAFADAIGATTDFPDMLDVVARARELDAFAGQHDAQLAVHLHPTAAAWSVGYVQQHAARQGFMPGLVPGRMVLPSPDEGAPPVLTLGFDAQAALADDPNHAALRDVVLTFDVPQTAAEAEPFATWRAAAQALASDMEAALADDNGQPLGPPSFEAIGGELGRLYDALASRDLAAGSMAARRLFS